MQLVLSVFQGVDLFGRAIREECPDWHMVWGPEAIWGDDIRGWHVPAGVFWGVVGTPPCQAHSRMANIARHRGYAVAPDLIPDFERIVEEAQPVWFLMENVPQAPPPFVPGYVVDSILLNNRWLGEEQNRLRRISFGTRDGRRLLFDVAALEAYEFQPAVLAVSGMAVNIKIGGSGKVNSTWNVKRYRRDFADCLRLQGLPADFLSNAPFTSAGKQEVVGNGVPLPMGRAIARAVRKALEVGA